MRSVRRKAFLPAQKIIGIVLIAALSSVFLSPITVNAASESQKTLTTCNSLKTGVMYISSTKKCNDRIYETRTWYEKGSAPPGTPGSHMIELITCVSKGSTTAIIRARSACNSKTQRTALWQRPLGPPGSPTIKSVEMGILGSAILKIGEPVEDGGARVISYLVRSSPGDITATFTPDRIKAAKITGLTPGISYTFEVVAINSKGASLSSSASNPEMAPTVPSVPRISKVVATGANSAQVTFIAPTNNGGSPVISYTVTSTPGGFQTTVYQSGGGTINISNLAHSTPYTFTLTAKNAAGSSQTSSISTSITTEAPPPSPEPISVAPSAPRDTTISVAAIAGVAAPVTGATPVTRTTAGTGYTGTVSWSGSPSTFAGGTSYTATIRLTPTSGYTLTGVSANFFTVAGASSVTHSANSGVITAVFPVTVLTAPAFTLSSSSETRTVNTAATGFTIFSTGGAIESFSISATPAGMSFDTTTGAFSGTPTSVASATNYTITATNAAGSTAQTFTFTVRDLIAISVEPIAGVTAPVTGATPVTTTTAGTGYTGTVSWSGSPSTFAGGTSYTATITLTPTSGYTLTGVSANFFTVAGASSVTHSANSGAITAIFPATAKATQTITFTDPADITYGQSPSSLSATSTSTLTVAFSTATSGVCTVSGTTLTILTAGMCTINANQAGDANYESASQVIQSFAIAKATPSLSNFANLSKTVGEASFDLTAPTVANSLPGSFSYVSTTTATATISGATLTLSAAGTSLITATFTPTDTTNYNSATITMTLTLNVAAPAFTLSSSSETRTVNTAATGFTINSTGGAIASFAISATPAGMSFNTSTGALTGTPTTVASATTYTVTATNATGSTTQTFTFTVSRATQIALSITSLTTNTKVYPYSQVLSITTSGGSGTGATTFSIASGGTASGCTLSDSTATATLTATTVGTCLIQASKAADATYTSVTSASATFTFTTATQTITFATPANMTVGGSTQTVAPSASSSLTVTLASTTADVCTVTNFVITAVASGTCSITASQAGNANYEATADVIRTFAIKTTQTISFDTPTAMTVGGSNQTVAPSTSSSLTVTLTSTSLSICTVAGFVITAVTPGTCSITASQAGNGNYEAAADVIRTFAITGVINVAAISGVTAPVTGATPVTTTTAGTGYTGTVSWSGSPSTFASATSYTATITLTPTSGYTLTGVTANFFRVTGASSVTHSANSGVVTAVFPSTATTISMQAISLVAPVTGATPVSTITSGLGYSGTVSWSGSPSTFAGGTSYTATITLTPTSGYTLTGVSANYFRVGIASVTHSANSGVITAVFPATATTISVAAIAGVTAPVTGATPVTTTTAGTGYTGTVSWSGSPSTFAGGTSYTATIRLTVPIAFQSDYTLTGVTANFFTVTGASSVTHSANSGVITAVFPATATTISVAAIAGVTAPVTGATPVTTTTAGTGYTGTVSWSGSPSTFASATSYTATITLTPTSGYTLTGVTANFFTVAGASSVTNSADSGVITAVFSATATTISVAAIAGVTFPVAEGTPVTTITSTVQYTGTVSWSGSPTTFAPTTIYTATITLTPASGYTLTGVTANFFTVAGANSVTHSANSGVITAVFPATGVGAPRAIAITTQPTGAVNGSVLGTQPVVRLIDSGGNTVTSFTTRVVASISSGTGTLSGTTIVETSSGIATFTNLTITGTAGTFTLTFRAATLTDATSDNLTITPGTAAKVAITRASVGTQRRTAFTTQPQITIQDASNNTITSSTAVVTATITSGYNPRSTIGTNTATAVSGVATFSDLGLDGYGGSNYTITYSSDGLTAATAIIALTGIACDGKSFVCRLGDTGPGGGKVFYVASGTFTQIDATSSMCSNDCKYLEAAPSDVLWDSKYKWSGITNSAIGTTGTAIGTGYSNTWKIWNQPDNDVTAAAARTINYRGPNNLNDWFLPSISELEQLWSFNYFFGGFPGDKYWSSSEVTSFSSWAYNFTFNVNFYTWKYDVLYIRPVRAF